MDLNEEEIIEMTQIELAQSMLFPYIRMCMREYGPKITQNAMDFFSIKINQTLEKQNAMDKIQ